MLDKTVRSMALPFFIYKDVVVRLARHDCVDTDTVPGATADDAGSDNRYAVRTARGCN